MKLNRFIVFVAFVLMAVSASAQKKYTYTKVPGDPYKTRVYKLDNGLVVMLTANHNAPQIQTMIAVRAGSRNDPWDNTGLAHYLEHMLFKGTQSFGTKDYRAEQYYLSKITAFYGLYDTLEDEEVRARLYRKIDSVSYLASKLAIANEYDRIMQHLGATGTNAFTSNDQTVYINNIPANQLEKWLKVEFDRFAHPVWRLFHTELEAVYEEKNRGLDNDNVKAYEALMLGVFPNHPYGTQPTIGTVEHLKRPSLNKITEFYNRYYKADNMALIMSGDFDYDATIQLVDKHLGKWYGGAQNIIGPMRDSIDIFRNAEHDKEITVTGPKEEKVYMGFRTRGASSKDALLLYMTDMILANSQAGMLDINLNKAQKLQYASCSPIVMSDFCMHYFVAYPKEGQSIQECRTLVLDELEKLKRGEFDEQIMKAIVENLRLQRARNFNDNYDRCNNLLDAFVYQYNWDKFVNMPEELEKLTKQDIIDFAGRTYVAEKRATVYKVMGKDTTIQKVPKPAITPIETNREAESHFARKLYEEKAPSIIASFPKFNEEIKQQTSKDGKTDINFSYVKNKETESFSLYIRFDMGKYNNPWLPILAEYMPYISTATKTNEQLSREFFNLACEYGFTVNDKNSHIYLKGLDKNFDKAFALLQEIFTTARVEDEKWKNLVSDIIKTRDDNKTNKNILLQQAMRNYVRYGKNNPFTFIIEADKLNKTSAADVQEKINDLLNYKYAVWYYGPAGMDTVAGRITSLLNPGKKLKSAPKPEKFKEQKHKKTTIYFVNYDMVQAEALWDRPLEVKNSSIPTVQVFNEYFGAGMYSLVFQTIRESKALAYSSYAYIGTPEEDGKPAFVTAYVGTQADKLLAAMQGMKKLMDSVPNDKLMARVPLEALQKQLEAERITGENLFFEREKSARLGLDKPIPQFVYENLAQVNYMTMMDTQTNAYQDKDFAICLIGSKERISLDELKKFANVVELTPEQVFGY